MMDLFTVEEDPLNEPAVAHHRNQEDMNEQPDFASLCLDAPGDFH